MSNSMQFSYLNAMGQGPIMNNYMGFTSIRDSRDNLFSSSLLPLPPKFAFQERTGHLNWRHLMNLDVDKVIREVDLKQIENLLQNITYASLERDDLERLGDAHFIKLFKISQMSIEYLLYTQSYLESLCKSLDLQYKHTYDKTSKVEDQMRKYQVELKTLKKELQLKQKTLSTYEYLMKLPNDQEQKVIKCKHCHKFFVSQQYLKKHYQKNHPDFDFYKEFREDEVENDQNRTNRTRNRNESPDKLDTPAKSQINQEELLEKIKGELFTTLTENFGKIEKEINEIKQRQNTKQIEQLLENYEHKNEEEQKKLQKSLQKPADMLEELKYKWSDMFSQQTANMKEMIKGSVNEIIKKRKDESKKKKKSLEGTDRGGEQSSDSPDKDQRFNLYKEKIDELEEKFKEHEKEKRAMQKKMKKMKKDRKGSNSSKASSKSNDSGKGSENSGSEKESAKKKNMKEKREESQRLAEKEENEQKEKKGKKGLRERDAHEDEVSHRRQLMQKEDEDQSDFVLRQKERQEQQRSEAQQKEQQELEELEEQERQEQEEIMKQIKQQQREEEKQRQILLQKNSQVSPRDSKDSKLSTDSKQQKESKPSEDILSAKELERRKQAEENAKAKEQKEDPIAKEKSESQKTEEQKKEELQQKQKQSQQREKQAKDQSKGKGKEDNKDSDEDEEEDVDEEIVEEEAEEEKEDIEEELKQNEDQKGKQKQPKMSEKAKAQVKAKLTKQIQNENKFLGSHATIKSLFMHSKDELEAKKDEIKRSSAKKQDKLIKGELKNLNIQGDSVKARQLPNRQKEMLSNVNQQLVGLSSVQAKRVNNSLLKTLDSSSLSPYNTLLGGILKSSLK